MVSKTEKLYLELLSLRVATFEDISEKVREITGKNFSSKYIYSKYVKRLMDEGKLKRIRRNLYVAIPPLENPEEYLPDKFLVASKLRENYYLSYHTALEFHGCAYSFFNEVYVAVNEEDRFDAFSYKNLKFKPVFQRDVETEVEVRKYLNHNIRVSSKERTFVDCVDRVEYAGGWEELIKSLQRLRINFAKLEKVLMLYKKDVLFRKVGFVLEILRDTSVFYEHLTDDMLDNLRARVGRSPMYLFRAKPYYHDKKWNLYIPRNFRELVRGV